MFPRNTGTFGTGRPDASCTTAVSGAGKREPGGARLVIAAQDPQRRRHRARLGRRDRRSGGGQVEDRLHRRRICHPHLHLRGPPLSPPESRWPRRRRFRLRSKPDCSMRSRPTTARSPERWEPDCRMRPHSGHQRREGAARRARLIIPAQNSQQRADPRVAPAEAPSMCRSPSD
jgi:hypothetical protein